MSEKCPTHYKGQVYWTRAECKLCEDSLKGKEEKKEEKMRNLKTIVGLFIPVWKNSETGKFQASMEIARIPLGWIIVVIALIVKWL